MEEFKVKVESVKVIDAGCETSRYGSPYVKHSMLFRKLLINGIDLRNNEKVYFFSPQAKIRSANGFLKYQELISNNGWFVEVKGEMKGYSGHKMFDGGSTPNIVIADNTQIIPAINEGNIIHVKGNHVYTSPKNKAKKYNRVKLLKS